ncbi:MAG: phage portal protein, partial [Candidatus Heimdallarchaeaceae archaeon]
NGIWGKVRVNRIVVELWPYHPDSIRPVPSRTEFILKYTYKDGNIVRDIDSADIIHFMFCDPDNPYWGLAPLQAGAKTVDTDVEAVNWNKIALQNRAITDGVFSFKDFLTNAQWQAAREKLREQHQGSTNARNPWVLDGGATWQQMSLSPAEMDFINSRKMTATEICAIFQVPPPLVGLTEKTPYANMKEARAIFWLDTIIPLLEDLQSGINLVLTPEFGQGIEVYPDLSGVEALKKYFAEQVETAEKLWNMGVPFNEINRRLELGFDEIPGGDTAYVAGNKLPVGTIEEGKEIAYFRIKKNPKTLNLQTEEQKAAYWKAFDRRRIGWFGQASRMFRNNFNEEAELLSEAYKKGKDINEVLDSRLNRWIDTLKRLYLLVIEDFGTETYEELLKGHSDYRRKDFNPFGSFILAWAEETAAKRATLLLGTSKKFANKIITQGVEENLTTDKISRNLREFYSEDANYRAMRMARTEVVAASNYGSYMGAKDTAVQNLKKTWISARDSRVRDSHSNIDGQTVDIDGKFNVNGYMMGYPGDPAGPAEEVIHCRCTLAYKTVVTRTTKPSYAEEYSEDFKKSAAEVENEIKTRRTEKAFVLDKDGKILLEKEGAKENVTFTSYELERLEGNTLIHNHPNGFSFSLDDVTMFLSYKEREMRAIGKLRGKDVYRYILKTRKPGVYPNEAQVRADYLAEYRRARENYAKRISKVGVNRAGFEAYNEMMENLVKKHKELIYICEKVE